jgi:hypothetical protein
LEIYGEKIDLEKKTEMQINEVKDNNIILKKNNMKKIMSKLLPKNEFIIPIFKFFWKIYFPTKINENFDENIKEYLLLNKNLINSKNF